MRNCPNCGGGLKFDIASGKLGCPNCSSVFEVGSIPETRLAQATPMEGTLQAMIFTCPQCGGEVMSTSETAAGFCSFCGASVQLNGRLANESLPEKIVPFKITKEQCGEAFRKYTGDYFFSPGNMQSKNARLEFRGIYMPYWDYTVHQQAHVMRTYSDEHRQGDYIVTKHYNFDWDLNEDIENIQHDASSSFNDAVGVAITPFTPEDVVPFDSGYMEGFYADMADTKAEDYAKFALDSAVDCTEKAIATKTVGTRTDLGPRGNAEFGGIITKKGLSLFPVWFMSYKSGDRVAYSAVNGQTGKVYVDLPVSIPKFFMVTAVLTAILFVISNLFITPTPQMDVAIAMLLSIASSVMFTITGGSVLKRDGFSGDKDAENNKKPQKERNSSTPNISIIVAVGFLILGIFVTGGGAIIGEGILFESPIMEIIAIVVALVAGVIYLTRRKKFIESNGRGLFPAPVFAFASAVLGMIVIVVNPVEDIWYYGITTVAMVIAAISLISVISLRNLLCTRRAPQFDTHKGGDHRAR